MSWMLLNIGLSHRRYTYHRMCLMLHNNIYLMSRHTNAWRCPACWSTPHTEYQSGYITIFFALAADEKEQEYRKNENGKKQCRRNELAGGGPLTFQSGVQHYSRNDLWSEQFNCMRLARGKLNRNEHILALNNTENKMNGNNSSSNAIACAIACNCVLVQTKLYQLCQVYIGAVISPPKPDR